MLTDTKVKMRTYGDYLRPSSAKAQCYRIARLAVAPHGSIAEAIKADHRSIDGRQRAAQMMVDAGAAKEINKRPMFFGTFVFEDGSSF